MWHFDPGCRIHGTCKKTIKPSSKSGAEAMSKTTVFLRHLIYSPVCLVGWHIYCIRWLFPFHDWKNKATMRIWGTIIMDSGGSFSKEVLFIQETASRDLQRYPGCQPAYCIREGCICHGMVIVDVISHARSHRHKSGWIIKCGFLSDCHLNYLFFFILMMHGWSVT